VASLGSVKSTTRIFVSHLAGKAVFDQDGDQVGRVRDMIVQLGPEGQRPRVLGLVSEVTGKRRVFLPITRVTAIETGQIISSGLINMRRFQQRPNETLVLAELLDRKVRLADGTAGRDEVQIKDVAIEQTGPGYWEVAKATIPRRACVAAARAPSWTGRR
jgi:sporulation protein YlmC with PRC-barrel domain